MVTSKIIEGLQILEKYRDSDSYNIGAEHDTIYAYRTDRPVQQPDLNRMIELGWSQEDKLGEPDENGEFYAGQYNPKSSWFRFT
jgi:hypothetical protein